MQNRIDKLFSKKKENILSVFLTAGFPKLNDTLSLVKSLSDSGADMIEVGIPFSDPVADGPVIQQSSQAALENGMNLKLIFEQLKDLRKETSIPVLLMGYLNPVLKFGLKEFYKKCAETGIDGLIIPDLPLEEYLSDHKVLADQHNIHMVFLVSPGTKPERIKLIDQYSRGFIYVVSSNATTGTGNGIPEATISKIKEMKNLKLKNPLVMGFGIKGHKEFTEACKLVNGAIVGSSFIQLLTVSPEPLMHIPEFISNIKLKTAAL